MPRRETEVLQGADAFLDAVRDPGLSLRDEYHDDPAALAERLNLLLPRKPLQVMEDIGLYDPATGYCEWCEQDSEENRHTPHHTGHAPPMPGLRDLVEQVCLGTERNAAVVGPRGGGKSQGVSFIEFFLVFIRMYDALNLGGSELQADQVYQYLVAYIQSDDFWKRLVKGDSLASKTTTVDNAWIRVLTASSRSVRSPHAGGRKPGGRMAGGILVIDEEAEAAPEIVSAALPTINTARPSVNVRSSTFHNAVGSFADLIDNHETMGYQLFQWNVFDVSERCEDECENCEPCFAYDHFEDVVNPDTQAVERKLKHRAYCGGIAHYAEGWVPIEETRTLWKRMMRNHAQFEVEQMGSRPPKGGSVIKDALKFQQCITTDSAEALYQPLCPVTVCVDWGGTNAGVEVWQEQPGDRHVLLYAHLLREHSESELMGDILQQTARYRDLLKEVAADIGGGGIYFNPKLREDYRLPVRDVNFNEDKESAVAAWNIYNEDLKLVIPDEFVDFVVQVKGWKRANGRIQKGNDHLCDAGVCYFSSFVDRLGITRIPIPPKTFASGSPKPDNRRDKLAQVSARQPTRRPVGIRSIGGSIRG